MREFPQNGRFLRRLFELLVFSSCIILLLPGAHAQAASPSLQSSVSVSGNNIPLTQVFKVIKKQTGLTFFYSNQLLDDKEKVSLHFQNSRLEDVLTYLFKDKNINYEMRGKRLLLNEKPRPAKAAAEQPQKVVDRGITDSIDVKGQVMDPDGKPLYGVSIMIGHSSRGATTDEFGTFVLHASIGDTLRFSMVGMVTEVIRVNNPKILKVTLQASVSKMNEAVVVGYGRQRKITMTGAVSSVNMEDMRTPVPSLSNALAGKVAGVISVQSSGEPGYDNSTFTIRGISTFKGNTAPLIIVDGVQREDVNSTYGGAFNNIDPEDISSISLLKDASSTAMYGAKGANGVLIITTKRGQAGKAKISLKAETGMTGFTKAPQLLDGVNYMKLLNEAKVNSGSAPLYSSEQIQKTASGLDPYLYPNVNWIDAVYRKNSSLTNANLNVNGGSEAVRYYLSASFYNQDGPYRVSDQNGFNPNLNFKRYDFRSNVDVNVTKTTLLQMNLGAMLVNSKYPGISAANLWYISYATSPVAFPTKYPDGKWAGPVNNGGNNPLNEVQNDGYSSEFRPSVQSVFTVTQKLDAITKGLSAYGRFSFDSYGEFDNSRSHANDLWFATGRSGDGSGQLQYNQTRTGQQFLDFGQSSSGERIMYLEGNLNYEKSLGDHHIGAMALYNIRNRLVSLAGNLIGSIPYRNEALAGRLTYSFNDRYLAEVNAGYTGSENFEPGKKFGFFPSVSAGWVISRERFFDAFSRTFNLLKIRGSYGIVGNDQIGDPVQVNRFPYLTQIGGGNTTGLGLNGTTYYGQTENVIGVQNLTWEKSYKSDLGLEIGVMNKLNLIVDVFKEHRKNILIQRQTVASLAGYNGSKIFANLGEMNNLGMDASVEYTDKFGKVGLRLYGNVTYSKNKIVFQDEPAKKYAYQRGTGHHYGEFTGYISDGLFKDQNDVDNSPKQNFNPVFAGDIKYKNLNPKDDNVIDAYDWTYLGKSWFPTWLYGTGFTVSYHNFDLSLFFQGTFGSSIMANGSWFAGNGWGADGVGVVPFSGIGQYPNNTLAIAKDRWTPENPRQDAYYPRLTMGSLSDNNYQGSTRWLKNGDYLRLKQSSIGYTLSSATLKKGGLSSLYFYLSGQNLLTFSKFKLWDPELGSNGAKYPITRMITCGIRAQF